MGKEIHISVLLNQDEMVFDLELLPETLIDEMVQEIVNTTDYREGGHTSDAHAIRVLKRNGQPIAGRTIEEAGINSGDQLVLEIPPINTPIPPIGIGADVSPAKHRPFFKNLTFWLIAIVIALGISSFFLWQMYQPVVVTQLTLEDIKGKYQGSFTTSKKEVPITFVFSNIQKKANKLYFEFKGNNPKKLGKELVGTGSIDPTNGVIAFQHKLLGVGQVSKEEIGTTTMITIKSTTEQQKWKLSK